jgi:hypothetical protein
MPRSSNNPSSRNVHHSNLKLKQGKFLKDTPHFTHAPMKTRSSKRKEKHTPDVAEEDIVIVAQNPKKVRAFLNTSIEGTQQDVFPNLFIRNAPHILFTSAYNHFKFLLIFTKNLALF